MILYKDAELRQFGPPGRRRRRQILDGDNGLGAGYADVVGQNHVRRGHRRTQHASLAQGVLEDGFLLKNSRLRSDQRLLVGGDFRLGTNDFKFCQASCFDLLLDLGSTRLATVFRSLKMYVPGRISFRPLTSWEW